MKLSHWFGLALVWLGQRISTYVWVTGVCLVFKKSCLFLGASLGSPCRTSGNCSARQTIPT